MIHRTQLTLVAVIALFLSGCDRTAATKPSTPEPGLDVLVAEPFILATYNRGGGFVAETFKDGSIYVGFANLKGPAPPHGYRSTDGGKTWTPAGFAGVLVEELSDGRSLAFEQMTRLKSPGVFTGVMRVSKDGWRTVEGPMNVDVSLPEGTGGTGDDGLPFEGPVFWRSVVELPNGDLLCTMYGYFKGDNVPIDMPPESNMHHKPGYNKYRSLVIRSKDRGKSWSYLSTIAYDPSVSQEGFCEPSMTRLADGRLVCIMRTGRFHDPMRLCWSSYNGASWTKPISTGVAGVDPDIIAMSNGVVACGFGVKPRAPGMRRERYVMFSLDQGRTWTNHTLINAGLGGTYPAVREIRPGELLFVSESQALPEGPSQPRPSKIYALGTVLKVKKRT